MTISNGPRVLSISPMTVIVAPGYERSEVEDLLSRRKAEGSQVSYQTVFKRLLRGEKDVAAPALVQNGFRNFSPFS